MLFQKKPCVIAGLVAAMGVGIALSVPASASALDASDTNEPQVLVEGVSVADAGKELLNEVEWSTNAVDVKGTNATENPDVDIAEGTTPIPSDDNEHVDSPGEVAPGSSSADDDITGNQTNVADEVTNSQGGFDESGDQGNSAASSEMSEPFESTDAASSSVERFEPKQVGWNYDDATGNWYYADSNNVLVENSWRYINGAWYWLGKNGVMATGFAQVGEEGYNFSNSGAMYSGCWSRDSVDNSWYFSSGSGSLLSKWQYISGSWYWFDPATYKMLTGWLNQDGESSSTKYYLSDSGAMVSDNWITDSGDWYYADHSGAMAKGWRYVNGLWYYMDSDSSKMQTGWFDQGSAKYFLDDSGAMATGWVANEGNWYFADPSGAMATGWRYIGGQWYWLAPQDHVMVKGLQTIGASRYFFNNASGAMAVGWGQDSDGTWYWGSPSGSLAAGWVNVGGTWYYLEPDTNKMVTGFRSIGNDDYFFNIQSGAMATGWGLDSETGRWYRASASGSLLSGWQYINGIWYYLDASTKVMYENQWLNDKGKAYYLSASGAMAVSQVIHDANGNVYYVDQSGISQSGWHENYYFNQNADVNGRYAALLGLQTIEGAQYYFDPTVGMLSRQWVSINGVDKAYAGKDGKISSDVLMRDGVVYQKSANGQYMQVSNGEFTLDGAIFRADKNGHLMLGWVTLPEGQKYYSVAGLRRDEFFTLDNSTDGAKYYSDTNGIKQVGKLVLGAVTYFLGNDGVLRTGWLDMKGIAEFKDGRHHFNDNDGSMAIDWLLLKGCWYLFNTDGVMLTGWQDKNGQRYYLDTSSGVMKTGWLKQEFNDTHRWYFFADSGAMATGWAQVGGTWYFFTTSDNFTSYDNVLYANKGQMLTGWLSNGGYWYFLSREQGWNGFAEGAMVTGLYTIDGKKYAFDPSGAQDSHLEWVMSQIMWLSSGTQYLIAVDSASYHTYIFQGGAGNWTPIYSWLCGVWMDGYSRAGDYTVGGEGACYNWTRWMDGRNNFKGGYRTTYYPEDDIRYFTGICFDLGFHSTIGWEGGYSDWGQLGRNISHGCIRLLESCAKWIYDNALPGTRVRLF